MGFEPITATAALVAGSKLAGNAIAAKAGRQAAKATQQAGQYNADLLERKAAMTLDEMRGNNARARKNARQTMGNVRLDAGGSQLASDGSVAVREQAVADRLEAEILDQSRKSLLEADDLRNRAGIARWESGIKSKAQKMSSAGTLLAGFGDAMSILSK